MAWLPMYLLDKDLEFLSDWLSQEEDIAFLVSNGPKRWIAKKEHNIIADIGTQTGDGNHLTTGNFAEYNLWHIPSGQLPLLNANIGSVKLKFRKEDWDEDGKINNPWAGWTEVRTGANPRIPYFGAGHPGVIYLQIKLPREYEIRISAFEWIGNHYRIIGNGAEQSTEKFWRKLRRMAKKIGTQIPRCNNINGKKEIFAFPTAYEEIRNGDLVLYTNNDKLTCHAANMGLAKVWQKEVIHQ